MSASTVWTLLLQAQLLLDEAHAANAVGAYETFCLQHQTRELIAEAIDELRVMDALQVASDINDAVATFRRLPLLSHRQLCD